MCRMTFRALAVYVQHSIIRWQCFACWTPIIILRADVFFFHPPSKVGYINIKWMICDNRRWVASWVTTQKTRLVICLHAVKPVKSKVRLWYLLARFLGSLLDLLFHSGEICLFASFFHQQGKKNYALINCRRKFRPLLQLLFCLLTRFSHELSGFDLTKYKKD